MGGVLVILAEFLAARHLQVQSYGMYASGMTVARIGEALAVLGIPVAIFHFLPYYRLKGHAESVAGTVYAVALAPFAIGSVFGATVWLLAPYLAVTVFRNADAGEYIRLLAFAVPFMAGTEVLGAITRGFGHAKYYVIVKNLIPPVVFLATLGVMALTRAQALWITGAVAFGSLIACLAGCAAILHIAGPSLGHPPRLPPARALRLRGRHHGEFVLLYRLRPHGPARRRLFPRHGVGRTLTGCAGSWSAFDMILLAFHARWGRFTRCSRARFGSPISRKPTARRSAGWCCCNCPSASSCHGIRQDILGLVGPAFTEGAGALLVMSVGYSLCTCFSGPSPTS